MLRLIRCWSRAMASKAFLPARRVGFDCCVNRLSTSPSVSLPASCSDERLNAVCCTTWFCSSFCLASLSALIRLTRSCRSVAVARCGDWLESDPADSGIGNRLLTGDGPGDTKSPGDDWRDRMLGDGDARGLEVFCFSVDLRTGFRTGIKSSSSLLMAVASAGAAFGFRCSCDSFSTANRCFMR